MAKGLIFIYTGDGRGKSPAAIGRAVQAAVEGKHVVLLQFLKGKSQENSDFLRKMEPEIKLGLVEKRIVSVEDLKNLLECRGETNIILTGTKLSDDICALADEVSRIETVPAVKS